MTCASLHITASLLFKMFKGTMLHLAPPPFQAERPRAQCKVGGVEMHAGSHCWGDLPRRLSSVSFEQAGARWIGERWWAPYAEWIQLGQAWIVTNPRIHKGSFPGQVTSMGRLGRDRGMYLPQNVTEQSWTVEWLWTSKSCWLLWSLQGSCLRLCLRAPRLNHVHIWSAVISCDQLWSAVISMVPEFSRKWAHFPFRGKVGFLWFLRVGGSTLGALLCLHTF